MLCISVLHQETYDTCTGTMSSIRDASRQLLLVPPGSLQASATKACVVQAREMEPHLAKLETILFGDIQKVDIVYIKKVLRSRCTSKSSSHSESDEDE